MFNTHRLRPFATAAFVALVVAGSLVGQAAAKPKPPNPYNKLCGYQNPQTGEIEFYSYGETIGVQDANGKLHFYMCDGTTGKWILVGRTLPPIVPLQIGDIEPLPAIQ